MKSHLHCDIDAEKPFIKYVCIFLLYAQDCAKYSFISGPINVWGVWTLRVSNEFKQDEM